MAAVVATALVLPALAPAADITWQSTGGSAWLTGTNWSGDAVPSASDVAVFGAAPTSASTGIGINFAGSGTQTVQAIAMTASRTVNLAVGSSSPSAGTGSLVLTGATINGYDGVVLRNSGTGSATLSLNPKQGSASSSASMKVTFDTGTSVPVIIADRSMTMNISLSSSNGFRKTGAGTLNLVTASPDLRGAIFIDGGVARYGGDLNTAAAFGPISETAGLYIANGATLNVWFAPTGGVYRALFISGTGVNGDGAIATSSFPTFTKVVTLTGDATVGNGSSSGGTTPTFAQGFESLGDYDLTVSSWESGSDFTIERVLDLNAGRLVVDGPQVILSTTTANSMSGVRIRAGTVSGVDEDGSLGANPATFDPGFLELAGSLTTGGSFALGANKGILLGTSGTSATGTLSVGAGAWLSIPAVIADNGGGADNLTKAGSGTLVLADANTYTGTTSLLAGTLVVPVLADGGLPSSIGDSAAAAANLVLGGSGILAYTGTGGSTNRSFRLNSSANVQILSDGSGPLVWSGSAVAYQSTSSGYTLTLGGANTDDNTFGNPVLDPGTGSANITKSGAGTWKLTGSNSYDGTTTVSDGLLVASGSSSIGNAALTMSGGRLDLAGTRQVAKAVSVTNAAPTGHTILNGDLQGTSYSVSNASGTATISARLLANANAGLTKSGSGTAILTAQNTFTGATTVSGGTLRLTGGDNRIATTSTLSFSGSSTLDLAETSQGFGGVTSPDAAATFTILGSSGTLSITSGSVQIGPGDALVAADAVSVDMAGLANFAFANASAPFRVGIKPTSTSSGTLNQIATATLATNNAITANLFAIGDVAVSNDGGGSTVRLGQTNVLQTGTINIGGGGRNDAALEFRGGLSSPSVTIRGTNGVDPVGTWIVGVVSTASNALQKSFTATVDLSAGSTDAAVASMQVANTDLTGINRAGISNAGVVIGSGTFTVGTLAIGRLAATGTVTIGGTAAANGTFTLANAAGSLLADSVVLAENAYLGGTTAPRTVSGTLAIGAGTVRARSIARGPQTGNATASAAISWTSGTLGNKPDENLAVSSVPVTLLAGSHVFDATGTNSITIDVRSPITGVGGFVKQGTGLLSLSGTNSYAGSTTVSAGTLRIDGNQAAALGSVSIAAGAVLGGSGTVGGATTILGTHSPGASPGLQTFSGGLAYAAGSSLVWELSANTAASAERGVLFDGIDMVTSGSLSIDPTAVLSLVFNAPLANGTPSIVDWDDPFWNSNHTWKLIDITAPVSWDEALFATLQIGNDAAGDSFASKQPLSRFELFAAGGDLLLAYVVPEPATWLLLFSSAAWLVDRRFRRSRRSGTSPSGSGVTRPHDA